MSRLAPRRPDRPKPRESLALSCLYLLLAGGEEAEVVVPRKHRGGIRSTRSTLGEVEGDDDGGGIGNLGAHEQMSAPGCLVRKRDGASVIEV